MVALALLNSPFDTDLLEGKKGTGSGQSFLISDFKRGHSVSAPVSCFATKYGGNSTSIYKKTAAFYNLTRTGYPHLSDIFCCVSAGMNVR